MILIMVSLIGIDSWLSGDFWNGTVRLVDFDDGGGVVVALRFNVVPRTGTYFC